VDEAGRGPLAGPVVAAAVILDELKPIRGLKDSKVLTEKRREALFDEIRAKALCCSIAEASVDEVQQSLQGMRLSSLAVRQQVYHALRDITNGAYFSDPAAWPAIGYPGPRDI
jgi:ribonuclease HII